MPYPTTDPSGWFRSDVADLARGVRPDDVDAALALGPGLASAAAGLGRGGSWEYLATLATLGAVDLTTARAVEPHLDALAILDQARVESPSVAGELASIGAGPEATWGVYAAAAPGRRVDARATGDAWTLSGDQPWCSLAGSVSHALVVAHVDQARRLFAVPMRHEGVSAADDPWVGRGLTALTSGGIHLDEVPAVPVGGDGWYLSRPGFSWGALGVAAVWFGGLAALSASLTAAAGRREPDQIALAHLGTADVLVHSALLSLRDAAARIDAGQATGRAGEILAARVRAVVAEAAERVLGIVGHALGPGPLVGDAEHARRVADLTVYVRQHHAERDLARLGGLLLRGDA